MNGHLSLAPTAPALPAQAGAGLHSTGRTSYMEQWAERYQISQAAIERARLKQGKARHRAHRDPLPMRAKK